MRALARIFLAARVRAACTADLLAGALSQRGSPWQRFGGFGVSFGDYFVAHFGSFEWSANRALSKTLPITPRNCVTTSGQRVAPRTTSWQPVA